MIRPTIAGSARRARDQLLDAAIRSCDFRSEKLRRIGEVLPGYHQAVDHGLMLRLSGFPLTARDLAATGRGPGLPSDLSGSTFDAERHASVHNLPPMDQLTFRNLDGGYAPNPSFLVCHERRPFAAYKNRDPQSNRDEATAWEAGQILRVPIVPPTREWSGPWGDGSLMAYVPNNGPAGNLQSVAGQKVAFFDYAMSHPDRIRANALERVDAPGEIAAIDNAGILKDPASDRRPTIRSAYIAENFGRPLDSDLMADIHGIDLTRFDERMQARGYSAAAAEWGVERIAEVQSEGRITGDAWTERGGVIVDVHLRPVSLPAGADYSSIWDFYRENPWPPTSTPR